MQNKITRDSLKVPRYHGTAMVSDIGSAINDSIEALRKLDIHGPFTIVASPQVASWIDDSLACVDFRNFEILFALNDKPVFALWLHSRSEFLNDVEQA